MKNFFLGFAAGVACTFILGVASVMLLGFGLKKYAAGHSFTMPATATAGGLKVTLGGKLRGKVEFMRGNDKFVFEPPQGHACASPLINSNGRVVYLIVQKPTTPGLSDYSSLVRFDIPDKPAPLGTLVPHPLLTARELEDLNNGKKSSVHHLDCISEDDNRILMTVSTDDGSGSSRNALLSPGHPFWLNLNSLKLEPVKY
ncbi:hypothetical protein [Pedosphaera parvula]|uniref:Uncharacterized protein n=1 Tax=Pedosphaera parvula (strain Ellin514) TaxID=320771 RepID=B9XNK9_PEDPL|nr:hypothetical protein [Pedosphaera parvula]EEF58549.1 hypothetical protein Cflav_PD1739 [Pedosphaera parvula Ellin514]